jgi:hypothetical protein
VTRRTQSGSYAAPGDVKSPDDLPSRLFLGDLDRQSFKYNHPTFGQDAWSVRYVGATPDTYVDVTGSGRGLHAVSLSWRGIEELAAYHAGSWGQAAQFLSLGGFPSTWETLARTRLESRFNVRCIAQSPDATRHWYVPDGPSKVLLCPVSVDRLHDTLRCFDEMETDQRIAAPIMAWLVIGGSVVNYVEGKCLGVPAWPDELYIAMLEQLGLPPAEPVWEQASDGSRALTVRRVHYSFIVNYFFRDEEPVIERLHAHGLIAPASPGRWRERYPEAPEFAALLMHYQPEALMGQVEFFDHLQTRRMVYAERVTLDDLERLPALESGAAEAPRLIAEAQRISREYRQQIATRLAEVEREFEERQRRP